MKFLLSFLLAIFLTASSYSQVDRSKRPEPGPPPEIKLAEYETFTLENGLKVFVVNNDKLPVVSYRLVIDRDPIFEGANTGYISIAGDLLRTGTSSRSKDEIDEQVDFIGASLNTSSTSITGSSLKKHTEELLDIISDIVLNYDFDQDELDKLKKQYISGITANQDDPNAIAGTVLDVLLYGKSHPYGEVTTIESVESINLDMCKKYVDLYFKPNIAYLAVVGDITKAEADTLVRKYLGGWERGDVPNHEYPEVKAPGRNRVAVVDRPASVQSVIDVAYPINFKLGEDDYIAANLMNTIFGGNSTSRLYMNLRESKGYTYGAYSSIQSDELVGNFSASLQARNEVTDSAVTEVLNEMTKFREGATEEELKATKSYVTGSFARALEQPQTIATFAINTAVYNLPEDYYATYLQKVDSVTVEDINRVINKYIQPSNAHILVVGNAEQIKSGLAQFGALTFYDIYGNTVDTSMVAAPEGLTADSVIQDYINAIGGAENLEKVEDRTTEMSGKVQGFDINMTIYQKAPDKLKQVINAMGMQQVILYDGNTGVMKVGENRIDITGNELTKLSYEATLGLLLELEEHNIHVNLLGGEKMDGKVYYKVQMLLPDSTKWFQYFDPETGLKYKELKTVTTPQGTFTQETVYSDYREIEGVKYPFSINQQLGPQKLDFTVSSVKVNTGLTDDLFKLE